MCAHRFRAALFGAGLVATAALAAQDDPPAPGELSAAAARAIAASLPLRIPVEGVERRHLTDTFNDVRGTGRPHEAIDIPAPRGTAVVAVADGPVVKLFDSKPGGLTVYQFDASRVVSYYYAHLDRYAPGLAEGHFLQRGERIGDVGSSGNANPDAPHLHFGAFELEPERQWWKGRAINPLPLFDDGVRPSPTPAPAPALLSARASPGSR